MAIQLRNKINQSQVELSSRYVIQDLRTIESSLPEGTRTITKFAIETDENLAGILKLQADINKFTSYLNQLGIPEERQTAPDITSAAIKQQQVLTLLNEKLTRVSFPCKADKQFHTLFFDLEKLSAHLRSKHYIPSYLIDEIRTKVQKLENQDWHQTFGVDYDYAAQYFESMLELIEPYNSLVLDVYSLESIVQLKYNKIEEIAWELISELGLRATPETAAQLIQLNKRMDYIAKMMPNTDDLESHNLKQILSTLERIKSKLIQGNLTPDLIAQREKAFNQLAFHKAYIKAQASPKGAQTAANIALSFMNQCEGTIPNLWESLTTLLIIPGQQERTLEALDRAIAKGYQDQPNVELSPRQRAGINEAQAIVRQLAEAHVPDINHQIIIGGLGRRDAILSELFQEESEVIAQPQAKVIRSYYRINSLEKTQKEVQTQHVPLKIDERAVKGKSAYHKSAERPLKLISSYASASVKNAAFTEESRQSFEKIRHSRGKTSLLPLQNAFNRAYTTLNPANPQRSKGSREIQAVDGYLKDQFQAWSEKLPERFAKGEFKTNDPDLLNKLSLDFKKQIPKNAQEKMIFDREAFRTFAADKVKDGEGEPHPRIAINDKIFDQLIKDYDNGTWKPEAIREVTVPVFVKNPAETNPESRDLRQRLLNGIDTVFQLPGILEAITGLDPALQMAYEALDGLSFNMTDFNREGGEATKLIEAVNREINLCTQAQANPIHPISVEQVLRLERMKRNLPRPQYQELITQIDVALQGLKRGYALEGDEKGIVDWLEEDLRKTQRRFTELCDGFAEISAQLFNPEVPVTPIDVYRAKHINKNMTIAIHTITSMGIPIDNRGEQLITGLNERIINAELELIVNEPQRTLADDQYHPGKTMLQFIRSSGANPNQSLAALKKLETNLLPPKPDHRGNIRHDGWLTNAKILYEAATALTKELGDAAEAEEVKALAASYQGMSTFFEQTLAFSNALGVGIARNMSEADKMNRIEEIIQTMEKTQQVFELLGNPTEAKTLEVLQHLGIAPEQSEACAALLASKLSEFKSWITRYLLDFNDSTGAILEATNNSEHLLPQAQTVKQLLDWNWEFLRLLSPNSRDVQKARDNIGLLAPSQEDFNLFILRGMTNISIYNIYTNMSRAGLKHADYSPILKAAIMRADAEMIYRELEVSHPTIVTAMKAQRTFPGDQVEDES